MAVIRGANAPVIIRTIQEQLEHEHKVLDGKAQRKPVRRKKEKIRLPKEGEKSNHVCEDRQKKRQIKNTFFINKGRKEKHKKS